MDQPLEHSSLHQLVLDAYLSKEARSKELHPDMLSEKGEEPRPKKKQTL